MFGRRAPVCRPGWTLAHTSKERSSEAFSSTCSCLQASVALPRNEDVEFKVVRRLKDGSFVFSQGYNRTLPPIKKFGTSSQTHSVPITRHVHHQDDR
jgi:hypothetical protein